VLANNLVFLFFVGVVDPFRSKLVSFLFSHYMHEWFFSLHAFSFILVLNVDYLWNPRGIETYIFQC